MSQGAEGFGEVSAGEARDVDAIGGDDGVGLLRVFCRFFVSGLGAHGGIIAHWFFVCNIGSIPNTTLVQLKVQSRTSPHRARTSSFNTTLVQLKDDLTDEDWRALDEAVSIPHWFN